MTKKKEVWKPIVGYENSYEISNKKIVKSLRKEIKDTDGRILKVIDSHIVSPMKEEGELRKYVILHDGSKYNKENIQNLYDRAFNK